MKLYNRIFSTLLAVILMMGSLVIVPVIGASADEKETPRDEVIESTYITDSVYDTPEDKLNAMTPMMEKDGYKLYVDKVSGEVAVLNTVTEDILFSNPYDLTSSSASASIKKQLMSQILVNYVDNGQSKTLTSFAEAAMREQIKVMNIKNGVRVEYTIGLEESRKLVPRWIPEDSFEKYIQLPLEEAVERGDLSEHMYKRFMAFYPEQTNYITLEGKTQRLQEELLAMYPCLERMNIWVIENKLASVEINELEGIIKGYCTDYTFEQMDADHEATGYEAEDEQFPVFKMALEYFLDEQGMSVRLPCNGLRYDMSTYELDSLMVLPYMGAGHSDNPGYNFFPDGSGALFDYEELNIGSVTAVKGKVYGLDYAYHNISTTDAYQQAIRYPVYGSVASETLHSYTYQTPTGAVKNDQVSATVKTEEEIEEKISAMGKGYTLLSIEPVTYKRGFMAVIESGESLAELETYHGGSTNDYNYINNYFNPKPKDSYDLADSISVTSSSTWTVVSNRKYTGSIKIRYVFLTDEAKAAEVTEQKGAFAYYETSWLGMAEAYRDYLIANGTLTKLEDKDLQDDIPLYLEVFGAMETQQTFLTMPVDMMTPLTTFENVYAIYEDLKKNDVVNINFKLTGFANGGMYHTVPSSLKWEKVVGGASGFEELIQKFKTVNDSGEAHVELFPDFDFAYSQINKLFDSLILSDDAVKTIDNRYTSFRQYSAVMQSYTSFHQLAISPSRYSKFYEKLLKNYSKYDITNMSVASLGTALNSDFDEDEPYNREDNKNYTVDAFEDLKDAGYTLMTEGGNSYTWSYVDHILNICLDSSRYVKASAAVPFVGAVLHGYVQFAGNPLNEESDTSHAILKAIENGAGVYFVLSYQNTSELKEDVQLSQYYSIRYDIWAQDMMKYYKELNSLMKDVQTKVIVDHDFWTGERVLDQDELDQDIAEKMAEAAANAAEKYANAENEKIVAVADAWYNATNVDTILQKQLNDMGLLNVAIENDYPTMKKYALAIEGDIQNLFTMLAKLVADHEASKNQNPGGDQVEPANEGGEEVEDNFDPFTNEGVISAITSLNAKLNQIKILTANVLASATKLQNTYNSIIDDIESINSAVDLINNAEHLSAEVKKAMCDKISEHNTNVTGYQTKALEALNKNKSYFTKLNEDGSANADYAGSIAMLPMPIVNALESSTEEFAKDIFKACEAQIYDMETIEKMVQELLYGEDLDDDDDSSSKYFVDNKQIVVVSYGDRELKDGTYVKTVTKTFILNYNNFAVRVTYDDNTYTIPCGGYVVLEYDTTNGEG